MKKTFPTYTTSDLLRERRHFLGLNFCDQGTFDDSHDLQQDTVYQGVSDGYLGQQ